MKFKLVLTINKPRTDVWQCFDNPENMKQWQPSLKSIELVSGTMGQPGVVSKLTYEENERKFSLTERLTRREEPDHYDVSYENEFTDNAVKNTFIEQSDNETLWVLEAEFIFKTLAMKILSPFVKKNFEARTQKEMERFKELAESS